MPRKDWGMMKYIVTRFLVKLSALKPKYNEGESNRRRSQQSSEQSGATAPDLYQLDPARSLGPSIAVVAYIPAFPGSKKGGRPLEVMVEPVMTSGLQNGCHRTTDQPQMQNGWTHLGAPFTTLFVQVFLSCSVRGFTQPGQEEPKGNVN